MSGVFGILDSRRQTDIQSLINRIGDAICYRDWQVIETYWTQREGVDLGRAGIGVFNRAAQPVWNDQHTIAPLMTFEMVMRNLHDQDEISDVVDAPVPDGVLGPIPQDGILNSPWVERGKRQPASSSQQLQFNPAKG